MSISSPQPSVFHLFTIFRQISAGELRIPAFQRNYIWKQSQVTDLFSSVRDQFPIGSILVWYVDRKMLELAGRNATAFPDISEKYPTSYILDGMQRLTSLYGVFHYRDGDDTRLNVYYDLRNKEFFNASDADAEQFSHSIQMATLTSPRKILEEQARLASLPDGDALLEEMLQTQASFQDYMIPMVAIRSDDISRIVGIFERTNSTGTRLDTVDFMRAITWDQSFDLNEQLENTKNRLADHEIFLDDETIIKCVGIKLEVTPTSEGLLGLRSVQPNALRDAFSEFEHAIHKVSKFLFDKFRIAGPQLVPYEGQTLVLFKSIGLENNLAPEIIQKIVCWFWAAGFNESLRGKPDHYVIRAINDWRGLVNGSIRGLEPRLKVSDIDFGERRMIKGRALSNTFSAMFAANEAKSFKSFNLINPMQYISENGSRFFVPVLDKNTLASVGLDSSSSKIFANLVLVDRMDFLSSDRAIWQDIIQLANDDRYDVLESQFINPAAAEALVLGHVGEFLAIRAETLRSAAGDLVDTGRLGNH